MACDITGCLVLIGGALLGGRHLPMSQSVMLQRGGAVGAVHIHTSMALWTGGEQEEGKMGS